MLFETLLTVPLALLSFLSFIAGVKGQCNPLTSSCPPALALGSPTYSIDFSQQTSLPPNWTVANYESVTYGPNGAEFTFAKRYDAPYLWTNFHILFGRVETVVQAAPGTGMISSSVLISDDLDEIDWEWSGNNFGTSTGKVQTNYYGKGITGNYDRGTQPSVSSPETTFHTYTVDWTPTTLTWSVDGSVLRTMQNTNANSGAYQYPQTPMRIQLGLWDGGDADTAGGTVWWAGGYTNISQAPFTMYVKSVKITTPNPCSGSWQYRDTSGSAASIKCLSSGPSSPGSSVTGISISSTPAGSSSPSKSSSSAIPATYTVISGDIGYNIASKLGIPFTALAAANPTVNWDLQLVGQVLQVLPTGSTSAVSTSVVLSSPMASLAATATSTTTPSATSPVDLANTPSSASPVPTSTPISSTTSTSLSTVSSTSTPVSPSSSSPLPPSGFVYTSCNTDNNLGARALNAIAMASDQMTVAMCTGFCSGYAYMGLEYGRECYCGNALMSGSTSTTDGRCFMTCAGNNAQTCGGPYGLSLYKYSGNSASRQLSTNSPSSSTLSLAATPSAIRRSVATKCAPFTSIVTTTVYA